MISFSIALIDSTRSFGTALKCDIESKKQKITCAVPLALINVTSPSKASSVQCFWNENDKNGTMTARITVDLLVFIPQGINNEKLSKFKDHEEIYKFIDSTQKLKPK